MDVIIYPCLSLRQIMFVSILKDFQAPNVIHCNSHQWSHFLWDKSADQWFHCMDCPNEKKAHLSFCHDWYVPCISNMVWVLLLWSTDGGFYSYVSGLFNTFRPRQNGWHFTDHTFKCVLLDENVLILINIWLKFLPKGSINNTPALVQIMAWRQPGDKPLSEPMMVSLLIHICVTQPQWVKWHWGHHMIVPVPVQQCWRISWVNGS